MSYTTVKLDITPYAGEQYMWCGEQFGFSVMEDHLPLWYMVDGKVFHFKNEKDAMLFILKWI